MNIQGLWVGSKLSALERLSINSYLSNDYTFDLYSYTNISGVPDGVNILDANTILPHRYVSTNPGPAVGKPTRNYGAFSDWFRWKLLYEKGGYWSDLDMVMLKPYDFDTPYVFSSEDIGGYDYANCNVLYAPADAPIMEKAMGIAGTACKQGDVPWCSVGPDLLRRLMKKYALRKYMQPSRVFCPIHCDKIGWMVDDNTVALPTDSYAVHFWTSLWGSYGLDRDAIYPYGSLIETLKRRYS